MNISVRFARDLNNNRQIEKEEIISKLSELDDLDKNEDNQLTGSELNTVHFEYGKDVWLSGNRQHYVESDDYVQMLKLNKVGLEPPKIDLQVTIRPR
jgi:hypothetical protein